MATMTDVTKAVRTCTCKEAGCFVNLEIEIFFPPKEEIKKTFFSAVEQYQKSRS